MVVAFSLEWVVAFKRNQWSPSNGMGGRLGPEYAAIISKNEGGVTVLSTSSSWDLGRDGRAETSRQRIYVCSSLSDRVTQKTVSDVKRLSKNARQPYTLYFCSSQRMSEHQCNKIAQELSTMLSTTTRVIVLGGYQLAQFAEQHSSTFVSHYSVELDDFLVTIRTSVERPIEQDDALRLALIGVVHENSEEIRNELYRDAIRTVLNRRPLTIGECARDVSAHFRLGRTLPDEVIASHLEALIELDEAQSGPDGRYCITSRGAEVLGQHNSTAVDSLLAGRSLVRERLEEMIGHALSEEHFSRVWAVFTAKIASAFFERGQQLVRQIGALLAASQTGQQADEPLFFVPDLADAVASTSSHTAQQDELSEAVRDLFREPTSDAFSWLARLCASYVALCALGLEAQSGRALTQLLSKLLLVLDTDIALSLLCEGEPNHREVVDLVRKWRAIGGGVVVAQEVLFEVAHHAAIATYDYEQLQRWLPGTAEKRQRIVDNAFVRAFATLLAANRVRRSHWPSYIEEYLVAGKPDPSRIAEILAQEFNIQQLAPATHAEREIEERARRVLAPRNARNLSPSRARIARDKARRDASLYASIVRQARLARRKEAGGGCVLVSSARRLAEVEQRLREVGEAKLVISLGGAFHILALIPGVSIGVTAMQTVLFEVHRRFSSNLERVLLRIVEESDSVSLPWARRHRLMGEVRSRLLSGVDRTTRRGMATGELDRSVERVALAEKNLPQTAEILRDSLEAVVVDESLQRKNIELMNLVESLEREVQQLKVANRHLKDGSKR